MFVFVSPSSYLCIPIWYLCILLVRNICLKFRHENKLENKQHAGGTILEELRNHIMDNYILVTQFHIKASST